MPKLLPHEPTIGPDNRRFWHPKIELWPIQKLRRSKRNARTHSKKQREKLLAIIRRFGFINKPADFVRGRDVVSQVHVLRKGCPS
jgi:hypothetical protein